jgi:hypothetical protein
MLKRDGEARERGRHEPGVPRAPLPVIERDFWRFELDVSTAARTAIH